ncbi:CoA pyrophosphatase [Magnetospirillum sp. UT-4]|uniref:NUDIX hydrolase n=1 Tax=Magnetospirillum sp. UT-4 TaxID=2681467 RepID=UPI00137C9B02|nr:CoA pyrophosphatase [Magnetospirillum sp. UT-4]CAA7617682.1 NUDIX hydrolase [Magnetospirillum sp. UT-4]
MEQRHILPPGSAERQRLTREAIARTLAASRHPAGEAGRERGDAHLERQLGGGADAGGTAPTRPPVPAAVLVPLVERPEGLTVLLTQRTDHLAHHPGQISFPGGRLEDSDLGDAVTAALRETFEETGLEPERVEVLGRLDDYVTGTGFIITPVVGAIAPPFELLPDPFEVAEVFEVPLAFILDPENHKLHRRVVEGRHRPFWALTWEERVIWGATAGILVNLSDVLGGK